MNNKMIKGSVAGATGIVLLMGGFGTYALWSDTATLEGDTLSSGELTIDEGSAIVWDDARTTLVPGDWEIGDDDAEPPVAPDLLVPGDVITRTQSFVVTGTGKNLTGTIKLTGGDVLDGGFSGGAEETAYDWLDVEVAVTAEDGETVVVPDASTEEDLNDFVFEGAFNSVLTTVVTFRVGDEAELQGDEAQKAVATLQAAALTIQQTND